MKIKNILAVILMLLLVGTSNIKVVKAYDNNLSEEFYEIYNLDTNQISVHSYSDLEMSTEDVSVGNNLSVDTYAYMRNNPLIKVEILQRILIQLQYILKLLIQGIMASILFLDLL